MASPIFLANSHILILTFHLLLATQPTSSLRILTEREQTGIRAKLTLISSNKPLPKHTNINPLNYNESPVSLIQSPMKAYKDVYEISLTIGTPPVEISAIMDTGSDLIWTKCRTTGSGLFYDSSGSKSFFRVNESCASLGLDPSCKQFYEDGKKAVSITLGQEALTVGNTNITDVIFGCGTPDGEDVEYDGIVGMGRGDLSLVSQLKESVFSYCLGSRFGPKTDSVLLTGSKASVQNTNTKTMPLIKQEGKPYYYISLEGISVGETKLAVTKSDFEVSSYGDGGMIIDSGTTFTYLEQRIINMISDEFMNQTMLVTFGGHKEYKELKHCFKPPGNNVSVPKLVFHFEGADWELVRENYIYQPDGADVACLAFIDNEADKVSIFGNMQQQNMMVIYDLDKNSLSFKPANCNQL